MRLFVLSLLAVATVWAQPVRYTLRFPAAQSHYVEVEASVPTGGRPTVDLMMAVWTPGSYLVREYSRNVEALTAKGDNGVSLVVEKTLKNRWRVMGVSGPRITLSYRVYCHEMSVQTSWVESGFALLSPASVFITTAGELQRPYEVKLEMPGAWKTSMTGLDPASDNAPNHYFASDFDTLIDSPIVAGNPAVYSINVDGVTHYLVNTNESGLWDGSAVAKDVEKIAREYKRMWGFFPFKKYVFLNMIVEGSGGLEHKNSVVMMTSRYSYRLRETAEQAAQQQQQRGTYQGWLGLVSHEYFHAWNVKRLRPVELGPFDYENEVYTRSLWISEGFTSYYGPLALRRAGLTTREQYLAALSRTIESLQTTPGRLVQPVEQSSFDAWIKHYRPDENSPNTAISYYTKGAVIGFLLDARIRKLTDNAKSLDDVMRLAYQRFSGEKGFTPEQFRRTASEVAGADLSAWFTKALETSEELDYVDALNWLGLQFKAPDKKAAKATTGLDTKVDNGRIVVSQVKRGTAGFAAGVNANDELIAIDDLRIRPEQWPQRLEQYKPGDTVTVLVSRRDELMRIPLKLTAEPQRMWRVEANPKATDAQKASLKLWLRE